MEQSREPERVTIEDFGPRVTSAWNDLRSTTRSLLEKVWRSPTAGTAAHAQSQAYDPRADQELSKLLTALDERAHEAGENDSARNARRLADACAEVLADQTQSADVFAKLIQRAHDRRDYARVDALAGAMAQRLAPSEICELARSANVVVRALAQEALTQMPPAVMIALLRDPVDAGVARATLQRQASEFNSREAQQVLQELDQFGLDEF